MPCYEHFVALQKRVFVPLVVFLLSHMGTGLYYIDSTALAIIIVLTGTRSPQIRIKNDEFPRWS